MHFFRYREGELFAEDIPLSNLADKYGTPLYVYSKKTLERHFKTYTEAFRYIDHIVCFAVKSNPNPAILKTLARLGAGADIVSGGELYLALKAGIPPEKIVYTGVGKTEEEIIFALKSGILMFNIESEEELREIDIIAGKLNRKARIGLRVNPEVDARTHPYISTGLKKYKFGIPIENAIELYVAAKRLRNVEITGIHSHIGSQITAAEPFIESLNNILRLTDNLRKIGISIKYLDIGGGLGIRYKDEEPPLPGELSVKLRKLLVGQDVRIILEPGRSIVGNAGILLGKVLYTKKAHKTFIITDTGMNDLIRPTLYQAYHQILPLKKSKLTKTIFGDLVGPICESGDYIAKERVLPNLKRGDYFAVMSAGAYGFSMSSNYNARPRAAEVLVDGKKVTLIRKRETYQDLLRNCRV
ncbi:MAG: diaminopimelate decarboxylase [Deltaproteobacteria bacterium]|nr:diaminopimelate decarboxylase [Deltaproteobacteria bacterium]